MAINLNGATVDTGPHVQALRVEPLPVVSSAGVKDMPTLARQQLVNAVPAPAFIPNANPQGATSKPSARASTSSALAAQFIAQDASMTQDELAIFAPPPVEPEVTETPEEDDFLSALRVARGDIPTKPVPAKAATAAMFQPAPSNPPEIKMPSPTEPLFRPLSPFAVNLPQVQSQWTRPANLTQARGATAYQLAAARNAMARRSDPIESTL